MENGEKGKIIIIIKFHCEKEKFKGYWAQKKGRDSRNHLGQKTRNKQGKGKAHKKGSLHIRQELIFGKRF
jgi:hypothetical protein